MLNKTKLYWFFQITGWLIYVFIVGVFNILTGNILTKELVYSLLAIFLIVLSIAHLYRIVIVKLNWMRFSIPQLIPRILFGTILSGIVVYLLKSVIIEWIIVQNPYEFNWQDAFPSIISWTLLFLIWSLLYFLFHYVNNYKKNSEQETKKTRI